MISYSMSGRSAAGLRFFQLREALAIAPPNTVAFPSGTAWVIVNPKRRMNMEMKIPPPPIPEPAETKEPQNTRTTATYSLHVRGNKLL
eukprot:CAMPEP_0206414324 /NCGR_PEP_ID=MMETSP0294-20121207/35280_1 /ASSEMBLY_ACC=CAM_ASM_000327 /TAXON_ID=39354 /ORGANISM="Heterosigma akashiwo, Strain CCMP2393" /LENGTH=87 /DNA_ID=CAMNT_0053876159 /DNA_START=138 /DNA_END=401 /DNA_ORIENTATION=-